jgi:hypothetical protein
MPFSERSIPVTRWPSFETSVANDPFPHPISSIRELGFSLPINLSRLGSRYECAERNPGALYRLDSKKVVRGAMSPMLDGDSLGVGIR